ncbi:FtsX-like permease family protein [Saccharibacillus brassicae]|uniref:FtsX-like permease family protein n=1 Tax=Saccharibacillus brassicae TaxID=2583377 RepID=A0A4Y6USQ6_SACBS|nr:FtsX-like permease family protein [Saccharibacillus brassicae]QDH19386.1 FtsX-like permease family protein [Saccharibacillus brassicae]
MYAVWKLSLANLKKRKIQNSLIALLVLLSTLLLSTSVILISNTDNLFTGMHEKTNGSQDILRLDGGLHDPEKVHAFWEKEPGVSVSKLLPYHTLSGVSHNGSDIPNLLLFMMDTPQRPLGVDELLPARGTLGETPAAGQAWIPTSLAYSHDIAVGDTLSFKTSQGALELNVSAVVVDIPYGGPFSTESRIWMNEADYGGLSASEGAKSSYMMGIRYDNYADRQAHWTAFEQFLGTPYLESVMTFAEISSFYLILNQVIGFVMIFLAVVMMAIALFTIGFTISDAILTQYRTIGVLKSLGLTSGKTIGVYLIQYAFLSAIAIVPGLILSRFLSRIIVDSTLSYLKTDTGQLPLSGMNAAALTGVLIFLLVLLCVWAYGRRARHIAPVQAIRYGMSESDSRRESRGIGASGKSLVGFGSLPAVLVVGARNLLKNIKTSTLMLILAMVTSAVLVLGYVVLSSVMNIQQTSPQWGYDNSDITVRVFDPASFSKTEFEAGLAADDRIKNVSWHSGVTGVIESPERAASEKAEDTMGVVVSIVEGSYDDIGFAVLEGANPVNPNETAIGVNVAKTLSKSLGDTVELYVEGQPHVLTVTGIYQSVANSSNSVRIKSETVQADNPAFSAADVAYINLNDHSQADTVVPELNERYAASISAATQKTLLDSVFREAATTLILPMSFMGALFITVTLIIIYSICLINIRKEIKTYGIYKSIGMSSGQIRRSVALGVSILATVGALLGILLGVYALPVILESILAGYGMVDLPLVFNGASVALIACLSIPAAAAGSWLSSGIIRKTSPRILVVE